MSERAETGDPGDEARAIIAEKTTALRAARAGVWTYDPGEDRLRYCLGAARTFGLPSAVRLAGLPLSDLAGAMHPADRPHYRAQVAPVLRRGGGVDITFLTDPVAGPARRLLMRGAASDDGPGAAQVSGIVVELAGDDARTTSAADAAQGRGATADLVAGIEHILAARACLADLEPGPAREALPLVDVLLRHLGRVLARDPLLRDPLLRDPLLRDPLLRDPLLRDPGRRA